MLCLCLGKDQGCLANNLQWWIKAIRQVLWAVRRPASCRNGGAALGFGCRNFKAQLWETKFLPIMINSNINRAKVKKYEMICEQDSYSLKKYPEGSQVGKCFMTNSNWTEQELMQMSFIIYEGRVGGTALMKSWHCQNWMVDLVTNNS